MGLLSRIKKIFRRRPPFRLGIAFGSGGAKGLAHLGALKAFEEAGIRFSVVTGASIGAIVGALYGKGYTASDMVGIVESLNRKEFSKNFRPFADLSFAERFLENYLEGEAEDLPVSYAAWATDERNCGVLLSSGKLVRIVTASSAIPPFFKGVEIAGKRYYDGAFTNAVPADACKQLGADFVVGIDLGAFNKTDEEKGRAARLFGTVVARLTPVKYTEDCKRRGYGSADFMLRPMLRGFSATDVSRESMNRMYELGYEEAKAYMEEIKSAIGQAIRQKKRR